MGNAPSAQQRAYNQSQTVLRDSTKANVQIEITKHTHTDAKASADTKTQDKPKDDDKTQKTTKAAEVSAALPALTIIPPEALPKTYADATNLAAQFPALASDILSSPLASGTSSCFSSPPPPHRHTDETPNWALAPAVQEPAARRPSRDARSPSWKSKKASGGKNDSDAENIPPTRFKDAPPHQRGKVRPGGPTAAYVHAIGRGRTEWSGATRSETAPSRERTSAPAKNRATGATKSGRSRGRAKSRSRSKASSRRAASRAPSASRISAPVAVPETDEEVAQAVDEDVEMMEPQDSIQSAEGLGAAAPVESTKDGQVPDNAEPTERQGSVGSMLMSYACYTQGPKRAMSKEGSAAPSPSSQSKRMSRLGTKEYFQRRTRERSVDGPRQAVQKSVAAVHTGGVLKSKEAELSFPSSRPEDGAQGDVSQAPDQAKNLIPSDPAVVDTRSAQSKPREDGTEEPQYQLPGEANNEHQAIVSAKPASVRSPTPAPNSIRSHTRDPYSFGPNSSPFTPTATSSPRAPSLASKSFGRNSILSPTPASSQPLRRSDLLFNPAVNSSGNRRPRGQMRQSISPRSHGSMSMTSISVPPARTRDARELAIAYAREQAQRQRASVQSPSAMVCNEMEQHTELSGGSGGLSGGVALGLNPATRGRVRAQSRRSSGAYSRPVEHVVFSPKEHQLAPSQKEKNRKQKQKQQAAAGVSGDINGPRWGGGWGVRVEPALDVGWDWANGGRDVARDWANAGGVGLGLGVGTSG